MNSTSSWAIEHRDPHHKRHAIINADGMEEKQQKLKKADDGAMNICKLTRCGRMKMEPITDRREIRTRKCTIKDETGFVTPSHAIADGPGEWEADRKLEVATRSKGQGTIQGRG
jgi:hypothetical protein